ncbi:hypothetical protein QBC46DRAFT_73939 [Diplogelasinospora grovesii]|uniref:Integrase zinc-binding domain-containing protein n=1 Tax=Diplogelasinospora grovesii TaxID=303347 RepID=A0AAN6MW24_9PEZI|nr:hypothetical protein QBC46DRAFT_73939 [Diplogelasinospora grovesii]
MAAEPAEPAFSLNRPTTFSPGTRAAFAQYVENTATSRRLTLDDCHSIIDWLSHPNASRPVSQKDWSRRNYVRKTFAWLVNEQELVALAKKDNERDRRVVTVEKIVDIVNYVHTSNRHAGWDATWRDVSGSYYGILRSDVIFLLKRCVVCAHNPRKRPKGSSAGGAASPPVTDNAHSVRHFEQSPQPLRLASIENLLNPEVRDVYQETLWYPEFDFYGDE